MKKFFKILFVNLLLLVAVFMLCEFTLFNLAKHKYSKEIKFKHEVNEHGKTPRNEYIEYKPFPNNFNYVDSKNTMRDIVGLEYNKNPILIFGCSFAFGDGLQENETFSYLLSKYSKRPVYNKAYLGWGPQHILYQLRRDDFYKEVKKPEYIIYVLIDDHYERMFRYQYPPPYASILLRYKLTKNGFEEIHPFLEPLWGLYTVNKVQSLIENNILKMPIFYKKYQNYFYLMMKESNNLVKKHYPNAKFVILLYRKEARMFIDEPSLRKKLENEGIKIVDSDELTPRLELDKPLYRLQDNHPSKYAWALIVPKLVKRLNL